MTLYRCPLFIPHTDHLSLPIPLYSYQVPSSNPLFTHTTRCISISLYPSSSTHTKHPPTKYQFIPIPSHYFFFPLMLKRCMKIDKYPLHLSTTSLEDQSRLSPSEMRYLHQHQALLHRHYLSSFLGNFPEQLRRLDDTAGGISMVDRPDLDTAVFVRVLRDVDLEDRVLGGGGGGGGEAGSGGRLTQGEICVTRYIFVREALGRGDVELI